MWTGAWVLGDAKGVVSNLNSPYYSSYAGLLVLVAVGHRRLRVILAGSVSLHHWVSGKFIGRVARPALKLLFHVWMVCSAAFVWWFQVGHIGWLRFGLWWSLLPWFRFCSPVCGVVVHIQLLLRWCRLLVCPQQFVGHSVFNWFGLNCIAINHLAIHNIFVSHTGWNGKASI